MQKISVLGATGSIGRSTLSVLEQHPDLFAVRTLAGGSRVAELAQACAKFHPDVAVIADESRAGELREALRTLSPATRVEAGAEAVCEAARDPQADQVLIAVVGAAALGPAFAAARAGKRMLLANKESIVCGGELLMRTVAQCGARLIPVDSEHSAIYQCLAAASAGQRRDASIILTCSGGPFRRRMDLSAVTPEEAVAHPNWSMGRKISVDSSTLMNKGLEVIEARWLFDVPAERIEVLVHPQSIIHSAVRYADGAVIAQLGSADMRTPIAYALAWPERITSGAKPLDFLAMPQMTFEKPDLGRFPHLKYAFEALAAGGEATTVLNAANEVAVAAFCERRIGFLDMARVCERVLETVQLPAAVCLEDIFEADAQARRAAADQIKAL